MKLSILGGLFTLVAAAAAAADGGNEPWKLTAYPQPHFKGKKTVIVSALTGLPCPFSLPNIIMFTPFLFGP
jgi:hypothetical protein